MERTSESESNIYPIALSSDRQKHCYVNCMSLRINLGGLSAPVQRREEVRPILDGFIDGNGAEIRESIGDLGADLRGQQLAYSIWKSCKELCIGCQ